MDMARNELKKTKDLLKMLTDSKTVPASFPLKRCPPPCVGRLRCYGVINAVFVTTRQQSGLNLPPLR